jgi:hypothetical protein
MQDHERRHDESEDQDGCPRTLCKMCMLNAQHTKYQGNGEGQGKRTDCRLSENMDDAHLNFSFTAVSPASLLGLQLGLLRSTLTSLP